MLDVALGWVERHHSPFPTVAGHVDHVARII